MGVKRKADAVDGTGAADSGHGSTIFVSNLSYNTTQESLQAAFDDIAPVKTAFVVYEKAPTISPSDDPANAPTKGPSKGVGYVTFAIKEDAEAAITRFGEDASQPLLIDGRAIRVKWADRKPTIPERRAEKLDPSLKKSHSSDDKTKTKPKPKGSAPVGAKIHDPDAIRTLLLSNLPTDPTVGMSKATLWKKVRKFTGAESVQWPVGEDETIALALFDTPAHAAAAQPKLHAHVFKGATMSVVLKKRSDSLFKPRDKAAAAALAAATPGATVPVPISNLKPSRAGRLIVRNVPWNVSEDDLRALFTPYGPIHSVTIPKATPASSDAPPSSQADASADPASASTSAVASTSTPTPAAKTKTKTLARGFAFIWYLSQPDASRAIERLNGTTLYAGYAADLKEANKKQIEGRRRIRQRKAGEDARKIAVDWAVSKERWAEMQKEAKEKETEAMDVDGESEDEGQDEDEEDQWVDEEGVSESEASGSDESEDAMDLDDTSGSDEEAHPPQPEEGSTLFVRNVPFEATQEDLQDLFRAFGPIRYARITMDYDTGRSRGTGFVSFWNVEHANACVEESERMREDMDPELNAKKNPFTLLTADPSSSRAARLVLHGRTLDVSVAVSRETAEKLRETGERAREKKDLRNLYLMREGVIFPSSPAASTLTKPELERRQMSFSARRTLLRSNPSLFISKTRLSIRNLPTWVSERGLKRLAVHAKRAFEDEVKAGTRQALSPDELEVTAADVEAIANAKLAQVALDKQAKKAGRKPKGRPTGVKQAKIVRQADRVDPLTGKGRSKGYGFVEMDTHADALRVLRWMNNNREANAMLWGWWRDEVKELADAAKDSLKALMSSSSASTAAPTASSDTDSDSDEDVDDDTPSKKSQPSTKSKPKATDLASRIEDLQTRVKKLEVRSLDLQSRTSDTGGEAAIKDGRTLHVEFSVENVTVVKRRRDKLGRGGDVRERNDAKGKDTKKRSSRNDDVEDPSARPAKKVKVSQGLTDKTPKPSTARDPTKPGTSIGSLIGKKRRARKAGGK